MRDLRGAFYMQRPLSAGEHHVEKVPTQSREMLEDKENLQRQEREMQGREQRQQREQNCQSQLRELQQQHDNLQLRYSNEIQRFEQRQRQVQQNFQSQLSVMRQQKDNLEKQFNEMQRREQRQLAEKQKLEQTFQSQLTEMREREGNLQRQLTEMQQREQNLQGRLSAAQNEMQLREQNFQGQLTEMRQREGNLQRQLTEMQQREQNLQGRLSAAQNEMQQREQNFQGQLQQRERDFESLRSEMRQGEESLQRRLNELHSENSELQLSLSTAQQTLNDLRRQETRDWVISRDEIHVTDKLLGRGGWASVYEGVYCGCPVAVKQIYDLILSDHNIRLFEREMSIASKCRHPHLLQFVGATNDEESPLFVTELMMKSLRDLLHERELLVEEIHVLCLDIARALNYLHQKKPVPIIHRDVSSANVLLWRQGEQWRGKVSDYGTANFMQQTMTVGPGALIYGAPESSTPNQTVKVVDVYSFGVLLNGMFIRELPDPERRNEQVALVRNGALRGLVRRCLHINPESRPSMDEIINDLMRLNAEL
ncbi:unnamed protein product [Porites evermanni]|uniref:Protein kinase domain-containing protein n=1 Tax=Porites evermanni TaxID=104178 RepID=A0ABN8MAD2_9CNID|nr:unnamed protein product [Porites evermanni]